MAVEDLLDNWQTMMADYNAGHGGMAATVPARDYRVSPRPQQHPFGPPGRDVTPPVVLCPVCQRPFTVLGDSYDCPCGRGFRIVYTRTYQTTTARPLPQWGTRANKWERIELAPEEVALRVAVIRQFHMAVMQLPSGD